MTRYQIELAGHLDLPWGDWFEAADLIHLPDGNTRLTCDIPDQPTLLGLLLRLNSLGLELLSLNRTQNEDSLVNKT